MSFSAIFRLDALEILRLSECVNVDGVPFCRAYTRAMPALRCLIFHVGAALTDSEPWDEALCDALAQRAPLQSVTLAATWLLAPDSRLYDVLCHTTNIQHVHIPNAASDFAAMRRSCAVQTMNGKKRFENAVELPLMTLLASVLSADAPAPLPDMRFCTPSVF